MHVGITGKNYRASVKKARYYLQYLYPQMSFIIIYAKLCGFMIILLKYIHKKEFPEFAEQCVL